MSRRSQDQLFDPRRALSFPRLYRVFQRLIGAENVRNILFRDHIGPMIGKSMLDLGCGPGIVVDRLPDDVSYVGIDMSARYVSVTQDKLAERAVTSPESIAIQSDAIEWLRRNRRRFDSVLAIGLLHHLSDDQARELLELSTNALCDGGALLTFDGVYRKGQSRVERLFLRLDRGKFVRSIKAYEALVPDVFDIHSVVRSDLLRIPYTHLIMTCALHLARSSDRSS